MPVAMQASSCSVTERDKSQAGGLALGTDGASISLIRASDRALISLLVLPLPTLGSACSVRTPKEAPEGKPMRESDLYLFSLEEERHEPRATFRTRPLRCPDCGSTAVSRLPRQNRREYLLGVVRIAPFRCEPCLRRFWAFSLH